MTLTIGRATLGESFTINQNGDSLELEGLHQAVSAAELNAIRQQVLGLARNIDEPVVPVTSSDSHLDGFYRVLSSTFEKDRGGSSLLQGSWQVGLQRVSDYSAPLIESILLAPTVRTNAHGLTDAIDWHALPNSLFDRSYDAAQDIAISGMTAADGDITHVRRSDTVNVDLEDVTALYYAGPSDWYDNACLLEIDYGSNGTFYPVAGRQIILPSMVSTRWRLGNGLIRLTHDPTGGDFHPYLQRWLTGSSAYSTVKEFELEASGVLLIPETMTVLRNSPHEATLRFTTTADGKQRVVVDIGVKRGAPWLEIVMHCNTARAFVVDRDAAETTEDLDNPTAFSGLEGAGIKATSADGDGLFYFISSPDDVTLSTAAGTVTTPSQVRGSFCVGLAEVDDNGTGYPTFDSPGYWTLNYMKAMSEHVRVVEQ